MSGLPGKEMAASGAKSCPTASARLPAIALAANDRRNEALSIAAILPPQQLSVQEIELMRSYLAQPETTPTPTSATPKKEAPKKK
jgi:hypothetical protein